MPDRTRILNAAAAALFAASAAWSAAAFFRPSYRGWTPLARAEAAPWTMIDRNDSRETLYDAIPRDLYLVDAASSRAVAKFVCRREPDRAPWILVWPDGPTEDPCR